MPKKRTSAKRTTRTAPLSSILARAAMGDFSYDVRTGKDTDPVAEGVQVLLEVVRERIAHLERTNADLSALAEGRTRAVRLLLQVTETANAASSTREVLTEAIRMVATHVNWPVGHVYFVNPENGTLRPSDIWYLQRPRRHAAFRKATERTILDSGKGLPGRVQAAQRPIWIPDVRRDRRFIRRGSGINIVGAFGFPVLVGNDVAAVCEFYSERVEPEDPELIKVLENIGKQLGRVVERTRSEQLIRREIDFSQSIINSSSDGILAFDREYRYTLWNPAMERITGIGKWEALGRNAFKLFPYLAESGEERFFKQALGGKSVTAKDRRFVVLDTGRAGYFDAEYSPLKNESGDVVGGLAVLHDVTQRRVAEQVLQEADEAHARLASIVESTEDAIISVDPDGTVLTWNPAAERMYGYSADEMIGRPVATATEEDDRHFKEILKEVIGRGESVRDFEMRRTKKDGSVIEVSMTVSPLRNARGEVVAASSIARDITQQKELMRRQREFVSITSHELRTPMTALSGYLSLALKEHEDLKRKEHFIRRASDASRRLVELTEDLLQVARLEEERVTFQLRPVQVGQLVEAVIDDLKPNIDAKKLEVTCQVLTPGAKVRADASKLVQIFRNLIDNAIKYTPEGGSISVTVKGNPRTVAVTIRDTGVGIDPKNLRRIFDKFFREYHEQSVQAGGTGLGLFITRELVDRQGGQLSITGRRNHGTTAIVRFPRWTGRRRQRVDLK